MTKKTQVQPGCEVPDDEKNLGELLDLISPELVATTDAEAVKKLLQETLGSDLLTLPLTPGENLTITEPSGNGSLHLERKPRARLVDVVMTIGQKELGRIRIPRTDLSMVTFALRNMARKRKWLSRGRRLMDILSSLENDKSDLEDLRDEMEEWKDSMEGAGTNLELTPKYEEVETCHEELDGVVDSLDNTISEVQSVSFPEMF